MADRTTRTRSRVRDASREEQQARFLKELRRRANVTGAARKAGVGRRTAYDWYDADEAFAAAWDEALEEAVDELEDAAWRRAKDGVLKPVFQKGEKVGQVREYSDQLMTLLLKAHRPERFRERFDVTSDGNQLKALTEERERLRDLSPEQLAALYRGSLDDG